MVYRRVELPNVYFEAISGVFSIFDGSFDRSHRSMYSAPFDAAICIFREYRYPYRFEDIHYRMVHDTVGIVRQSEYEPLLWLMDDERAIFGSLECFVLQRFMERKDVGFPILVVNLDAIRVEFPAPCLFIGETEVIQRYDLLV